jgi:starch synthase
MSSITEGLGSSILEAMAARRAVVGTRTGGIPEAVADGTTGLLVPPNDPEALSDAIVALLRDPARRDAFGTAGRARVEAEFSIEQMVERTSRVYTKWLERR